MPKRLMAGIYEYCSRSVMECVGRCSCCGAVIVGGLGLQLPGFEPRTSVKLLGGW